MKPAPFEYHAPASLDEAIAVLRRYGDDAKLLAGGQSLVPMMNMRLVRPRALIDLNRVRDLDYIREEDGQLAIGALTRHSAAERSVVVRRRVPLLARALPFIGHPAIRHRGTVCGSLAHADPAAEVPAVVAAAGGELVIASHSGRRTVTWDAFFRSYLATCLAPDEILVEVRLPVAGSGTRSAFVEMSRRHGDFAIVGVAVSLEIEQGRCQRAAVAVAGVGPRVHLSTAAAQVLVGSDLTDAAIAEAARAAAAAVEPEADLHASGHYRRRLTAVLVERAVHEALRNGGDAGERVN